MIVTDPQHDLIDRSTAIAQAKAVGRDPDDIRKAILAVGAFVLFANPDPSEVFSTGRWWVGQVERIGQVEPKSKQAKKFNASLIVPVSPCLVCFQSNNTSFIITTVPLFLII
jgi:hypothetical protein